MDLKELLKRKISDYTPLENYFPSLRPTMTEDEIMGQLDTANRNAVTKGNVRQNQVSAEPLQQYNPQPQVAQKKLRKFKSAAGNEYEVEDKPEYNAANISELIKKYFPKDQVDNALKVMTKESGGEWWKIGDDYIIKGDISEQQGTPIPSYGLFQIRGFSGRPDKETLMNPEENIKYAADLYKRRGWGQWTTAQEMGLQ